MSGPPGEQRPAGGPVPPKPPPTKASKFPRWLPWVVIAVLAGVLVLMSFGGGSSDSTPLTFSEFTQAVEDGEVKTVEFDKDNGNIKGEFKKPVDDKTKFTSDGPKDDLPAKTLDTLAAENVDFEYTQQGSNLFLEFLPLIIIIGVVVGLFFWMSRRAQGQMGAVMNIGRSKAKVYDTEKPKTTFDDVAGYGPVKEEITEVVDFLQNPGKFKEIGARIPKGVLLIGPPGTGKTLIARAVAGEAGVPFLSVTGSDFMEMFVGVGAARVRDLFQTARKQAPAIIFVDEIDSIGRKRGAGLGGGHDEREQTLNQMLAEMDGFESSEGVVMIAATNRPDVLDPALLRPGRFDRQITVPLPTQDERVKILKVHFRDKKISGDVDIDLISRGTPGMSGADLANLVNEAALFAVRRGKNEVHAEDFDAARDRIMMGLKRESMALTGEEKEIVAYHEAGHASLAYVLEHADPVHKVTILPTGMALGVTHQLPIEERHIYLEEYITDSLVVRLGGRIAEELIFGHLSTGAQNDLVGCTELARKMVREWGMSERVGPMAWGSQGAVFLGDDLMHTRDYSDATARVIDEETGKILRVQEERTRQILTEYKPGLEAVAQALLEHETLDGAEVARLIDEAMGRPCGGPRMMPQPDGTEIPVAEGDELDPRLDETGADVIAPEPVAD